MATRELEDFREVVLARKVVARYKAEELVKWMDTAQEHTKKLAK